MNINYKKTHPNAKTPTYGSEGSLRLDLNCVSVRYDSDYDFIEYDTGIAIEIPEGYEGELVPRSSITKYPLMLKNSIGVIDSDYRDSIKVRFKFVYPYRYISNVVECNNNVEIRFYDVDDDSNTQIIYNIGDRIAQLKIVKSDRINLIEKDDLSETKRNLGGFGSTGK